MRTIRYRVRKKVNELLKEIALEMRLEESFVIDLYALMRQKGNGVPNENRLKQMVKIAAKKSNVSEVSVSIVMRKRIAVLKSIIATAYFKGLCFKQDIFEALRMLIRNFLDFGKKVRQAQCLTCNLLQSCQFGQQYSRAVYDVTKVIDPDYKKKAHPDCPVMPDIDRTNQISKAAEFFTKMFNQANIAQTKASANQAKNSVGGIEQMLNMPNELVEAAAECQNAANNAEPPDEDCDVAAITLSPGDPEVPLPASAFSACKLEIEGPLSSAFVGNNIMLMESFMKQVTTSNLSLFELGRKFTLKLESQKKGKFSPTQEIKSDRDPRKMEELSDVTRLVSSEHGLPEEIFDAKFEKKELVKNQEMERKDRKQILYLLIDVSHSMSGWFRKRASHAQLFTRAGLTMTLAISIAERVQQDKGLLFVRFFDIGAGIRYFANDKDSYKLAIDQIANATFNGGGTNILAALRDTTQDIRAASQTEEVSRAEILLITDCEAEFDEQKVRDATNGVEFNVLDVSGSEFTNQGGSASLRAVATKYFKADEDTLNINDIVKLV